jgi:hypothetical protein
VAAVFGPLRRRVQAIVDRRFNRARHDAQRTVEQFGRGLRDEVALVAVRGALITTAAAVREPRSLGVWLRSPESARELHPGLGSPTGT